MPIGKITPISTLIGKIDHGAGTYDHNKLINKDMADQHPMEAIIGLLAALNQIDSKILTLDQKIDSGADFAASELNKLKLDLDAFKNTVNNRLDLTDEAIRTQVALLKENIQQVEAHLADIEERLAKQIENLSIEELSKRTIYRTFLPENPSKYDKFVLVSEYTEGLNYYKQTYDVNTAMLNGMWQIDVTKLRAYTFDELNALLNGDLSFVWKMSCYWYNNGIKKSASGFGLVLPTPAVGAWSVEVDLYGLGLTDAYPVIVDRYCAINSIWDTAKGVIAFPVRRTRDYDYSVPGEVGYKELDYNPIGEPGVYPDNFTTIYFDIPVETAESRVVAKLMSTIASKISDENLEPGNTNYKMKFVPAVVTAETFEPDTYYYYEENFKQEFIKTDVIKASGYYPAYEFNPENTYYEQVHITSDTERETKYVQVTIDETTFKPGKYYTYFYTSTEGPNEVNFMVNTKNYVENTPYYKVIYFDSVSKNPVYQKLTLTEHEFYSGLQEHNYYRLVTFTAQPEEYTSTRIQLDSDKSIYRNALGANLIEITDDNVVVGGENLIPNLVINKDIDNDTTVILENNAETVFETPIESLIIEIPNNVKHGFCSFISFETAKTDISVRFDTTDANKPLRFIFSGATVEEKDLEFVTETQYNFMFLCNGIYLEVYIQEIQLI